MNEVEHGPLLLDVEKISNPPVRPGQFMCQLGHREIRFLGRQVEGLTEQRGLLTREVRDRFRREAGLAIERAQALVRPAGGGVGNQSQLTASVDERLEGDPQTPRSSASRAMSIRLGNSGRMLD